MHDILRDSVMFLLCTLGKKFALHIVTLVLIDLYFAFLLLLVKCETLSDSFMSSRLLISFLSAIKLMSKNTKK